MSNVRVVPPPHTLCAQFCGTHHPDPLDPDSCCCGGDWPGTMTCHPCRNPNHNGDHCADGPEPPGGYRTGRRCNCVHKPAGHSIAKPGQARS